MRLSEYCNAHDIDRAISITIDSFVGSQKVSAKRTLARAFAKYTIKASKPRAGPSASDSNSRGVRVS
jgi:DNA replication licensing factor MCM2